MANRITSAVLIAELRAALERKDGYIMGARGQNPRTGYLDLSITKCRSSWLPDGWYYEQYTKAPYTAKQHAKALYWRAHCTRVWDCNGMVEGIYELYTGECIDSKARYNYQQWCDPKGAGMIPPLFRVPGAAVFWGDRASDIHHVAYLDAPVDPDKPSGDWYLIEARGVLYGVVRTRLYERKPDFWGWMTKYFNYVTYNEVFIPDDPRTLRNGSEGDDVKQLQTNLIRLGYDCGRWGADGDFGDATEIAVKRFQTQHDLEPDGIVGPKTRAALEQALAALDNAEAARYVEITGGSCYVRDRPGKLDGKPVGEIRGVAHEGAKLPFAGVIDEDSGWLEVIYKDAPGWVSDKYGRLVEA